ncbi:unnamed protein product, partial [Ectocarpus fasciculatus]
RVRDRPPYTCLTTFPKPINWQVGDVIIASKKRSSGRRWHDSRRRRLICLDCDEGRQFHVERVKLLSITDTGMSRRAACYDIYWGKETFACFLCPMLIGHEAPDCVCSTRREEASP